MTQQEKRDRIMKRYSLEEVEEILGLFNDQNESAFDKELYDKLRALEADGSKYEEYRDAILDEAVENGNFADCFENDGNAPYGQD